MSSSSASSALPDFSALAAKPPQRPTESLPSRPSTSNYKAALASATEQDARKTQSKQSNLTVDSNAQPTQDQQTMISPTSASWRPNFDRQQSWSAQDHKRAMQTPLMSPTLQRGKSDYGFSSKDGDASESSAKD